MRLEYFTATWCSPCKIFGPLMSKVTTNLDIPVEKIDIEAEPAKVPFDVMGVPTVIMFVDDKEVSRIVGYRDEAALREWILTGGI